MAYFECSVSILYVKCESVAASPEFTHIKHKEKALSQSLSGVHLIEAAYTRQGQVSRSLSHCQYNLPWKMGGLALTLQVCLE